MVDSSGFADVILPLPLAGTFTYSLPPGLSAAVRVGCRVIVPFGQRKFYSAIVVRLHNEVPSYETKAAIELLDEAPVLLPQQMRLWKWIADYYLCTLGEVYKAALPGGLKLESESSVVLCPDFVADTVLPAPEQRVLDALSVKGAMRLSDLQKETGIHVLPIVKRLLERGALLMKEEVRRTYKPKVQVCVRLSEKFFDEEELNRHLDAMHRSPAQERLLLKYVELGAVSSALALRNYQLLREVSRQELLGESGCSSSILNALCAKGIFELYRKTVGRLACDEEMQQALMPQLSDAQEAALRGIREQWLTHSTCLLHGVTSSGKTEIYMHLIREALDEGKQVLYLLPEIVLTAQLTQRLHRVFGNRLGVYHSRYPDAERVEVYQKMLSESPYDIIVGVRSSLFLPFKRLGLVIIDEEHETSFKQQEPAPRYHGRNTALVLAAQCGARTLLGSATPSLESYHNALSGKYGLVTLKTRFMDAPLPAVEMVDIREQKRKRLMKGPFSMRLISLMREALDHHRQVILFQNRRGYAPMVECHVCGWVPRCQHCDVSLTRHRSLQALTCHYCGRSYPVPSACPNCQSRELYNFGYGTERVEDELQALFPEARIARMDFDTTRSRQSYEQILLDFQQGRTDILVGTQMVTKGLDFQHVSLVGILNAGTMLSQPDFRSHERAFQLMAQVAGRAGRRNVPGRVVLQTPDVSLPILRQVIQHDYEGLYADQIAERELFQYPPFCHLVHIYLKHRDAATVERLASEVVALLRQVFGDRVLGPDTPSVSRVQQMHIRKVLLKMELQVSMAEVRQRLRQLQAHVLSCAAYKTAQFYYDVD